MGKWAQSWAFREKSFHALISDLADETNARIEVAKCLDLVAENIKELQAGHEDSCAQLDARILSLKTSTNSSIAKLHDITAEETRERTRTVNSVHADLTKKHTELKSNCDVKFQTVETDHKNANQHWQGVHECLRKDMTENYKNQEKAHDGHVRTLRSHADDMHGKTNDINQTLRQMIQEQNQNFQCAVFDIRDQILAEQKQREKDRQVIMDELVRESTERERDEAAIVDSIEQLMKQMRHHYGVQMQEWVESAPDEPEKEHRRLQFLAQTNREAEEFEEHVPHGDGQFGHAVDIFKNLDKTGDGMLSHKDLLQVLNRLDGDHWTEGRVKSLLKASGIKESPNGKVHLESFIEYLFGSQTQTSN